MRRLIYLLLLGIMILPATYSHAQVSIGIGIGGPVYAYAPPVCPYGYYGSYPYACAPYGYYGRAWFPNGVFIGAGPWYHRPYYRGYSDYPDYYYRRGDDDDHGYYRRDRDDDRGEREYQDRGEHEYHDRGLHRGWYKDRR